MKIDVEYVRRLEALVPAAEVEADRAIGAGSEGDPFYAARWTEAFHRAIDRAAYHAGLRTASWIVEEEGT